MEVPRALGSVYDYNRAQSWRSLDNSKGIGSTILSTTAIDFAKKTQSS